MRLGALLIGVCLPGHLHAHLRACFPAHLSGSPLACLLAPCLPYTAVPSPSPDWPSGKARVLLPARPSHPSHSHSLPTSKTPLLVPYSSGSQKTSCAVATQQAPVQHGALRMLQEDAIGVPVCLLDHSPNGQHFRPSTLPISTQEGGSLLNLATHMWAISQTSHLGTFH